MRTIFAHGKMAGNLDVHATLGTAVPAAVRREKRGMQVRGKGAGRQSESPLCRWFMMVTDSVM